MRPYEIGAAEQAVGDVGGFRAEHEDAGGIGAAAVEAAGRGDGLERGHVALVEIHPRLRARCAERGEAAPVLLDDDAVAGAERHVVARVVVEVLEPDRPGAPAALDLDLGDVRHERDAAGTRQHRREPPGGRLDRIDARRVDPAHDADGGAVAGDPAHFDLGIRGLDLEAFGDAGAHLARAEAGGLDPARIGHEDPAALIDLESSSTVTFWPIPRQKPRVDVLPDRDRQPVARRGDYASGGIARRR